MDSTYEDKRAPDLSDILREAADRFSVSAQEVASDLENNGPIGCARTLGRQECYEWFASRISEHLGITPAPEVSQDDISPRRPSADQFVEDL